MSMEKYEEKNYKLTEQFNGLQGVNFVKDDCADVDTYYTVDGTVDLLNEFAEENEQLKIQLQNTSAQRDEFHCGVRENANRVGKLKKENEQLKNEIEKLSYANEDLLKEKRQWKKLSDEYAKLYGENEQLKDENWSLKSENKILRGIHND